MAQALSYDLHGILKFKIVRGRKSDLRDLINLKFSFFEVENVENPDITLNIGKYKPSNEGCYLVDHKYYIKENYIYCRDSEGKAKWDVEISGFEDGETTINFNGGIKGLQSLMNSDFIAQNLLLRLIEYKLGRKGYFFAHSAGISKNGWAHIFAGRGGTFKTSLCMDFIRRAGFEFLGDDRVVLGKDKVLCFPMGLRVFDFICNNLSNESSWDFSKKAKFAKNLWTTRGKKDSSIKVSKSAKLKNLFLITKTNGMAITVSEINLNEVVDKLTTNNRLEDFISLGGMGINSGPYLKYTLAYTYIYPSNRIVKVEEDSRTMLRNILRNVPIYEIKNPSAYSSTTFKNMLDIIKRYEDCS